MKARLRERCRNRSGLSRFLPESTYGISKPVDLREVKSILGVTLPLESEIGQAELGGQTFLLIDQPRKWVKGMTVGKDRPKFMAKVA